MSEYDIIGPHGTTTCIHCLDDISGDVEGPYCSERCRYKNENHRPAGDGMTKAQIENAGMW